MNESSARPLVWVGCSATTDVQRAARHLMRDLGVQAIIGPNDSQDTLDVAQRLTIGAGVLLVTPSAMASSIAHLLDDDLVWQLAPSAAQRAPWMRDRLERLTERVARQRGTDAPLKLGVVYRDDALGVELRTELSSLSWNGKPLADPQNLGNIVRIDAYDPARDEQRALVRAQLEFRPDVIVLAGAAEVVTQIMAPLERAWSSDVRAPHYLLSDAAKVPELLDLARESDGLASRVHGTGVAPSSESEPVHEAFASAYQQRFRSLPAGSSGVAPAYDASLAVALAAAGLAEEHPNGA
ncbi:MAG TPA: ABC transporter substrate-binding protein, partial [Polyangiales bacterium]|nr:ABC transporter substrate-binding protein [Polyangiales bacterium]